MAGRRHEIGVGLLLIVAMLVTGFMAIKVGAIQSFAPRVTVTVTVSDATGISLGSAVSIAGVEVGGVDELSIQHDRAVLVLSVDKEVGVLNDVEVRVRSRSVLGEKYIELTPISETAPVLQDGDVLVEAAGRTEIDQLVNTMGSLLAGIDPSVLDEVAASIRDTLASDPQRLSRMLENADRALASIADATDDLDGLMATGETTLEEASRAIAVLQRRAEEAKPLLAKADRIFDDVGAATAEVPVTVKEARAALEAARSAMKLVNDSAEGLETVLNNLSEIDRFELRRILREDGILVRLRPKRIKEDDYTEPPK